MCVQEIDWQEEYKYRNDQLISILSNKNGGLTIKSRSENVFSFLMEQMSQRAKIVHNLRKVNRRKRRARKQNDKHQSFDTILSDDETNAMKNIFDILVQLLKDEGLTTGAGIDHDILPNIAQAKKAAIVDNKWEDATKFLEKSMKSVKPFDIEKLVQCYGEFSHVSNKLRDENLVLFIGRTGSGKSTTIHFLKGTQFIRDPKHSTHFIPADSNDNSGDDLKHIKLAYQVSESVTKYITPVTMSLNDIIIDDNSVKFNKNRIILCDTPGIGDSHGIEVEVANSLSLIHAIRNANSVCIVLVLSDEEKANRSELFKQTGHYVKSLLNDYKPGGSDDFESKLRDIGIIFTKFKNEGEIWELFDKFEEENDPSVDGFYLAKKITSQHELILIDPIRSKREEIIGQLFDCNNSENTNAAKWINDPKSNFADDLPNASLIKIKHQVKIHAFSIKHLISVADPNFSLIAGKLDNLNKLSKIIKSHKFIAKELMSSAREVRRCWKDICDSISKDIKNHDNVTLATFNNNMGRIRETIDHVLKAHSTLQMKYLEQAPSFKQMIYEIFQEFCCILKQIEFNNDKSDSEVSVVSNILKCLVIGEHFPEEKRFVNEFNAAMTKVITRCEGAMKNDQYLVVRYFTKILESIKFEWSALATKFNKTS